MVEIPKVSESRRRIEAAAAAADDERHRIMLHVYRDHWLAEVRNDVPAIMATLPPDRVSYRFDGVALFFTGYLEFHTTAEAKALYEGAAAGGLPMAGPFEDERWAFSDWGMVFEGINTAVLRGSALKTQPRPLNPDGLYFARWRSVSSHPMDVERRLMLGEHVFCGGLVSLDEVDEAAVAEMLG